MDNVPVSVDSARGWAVSPRRLNTVLKRKVTLGGNKHNNTSIVHIINHEKHWGPGSSGSRLHQAFRPLPAGGGAQSWHSTRAQSTRVITTLPHHTHTHLPISGLRVNLPLPPPFCWSFCQQNFRLHICQPGSTLAVCTTIKAVVLLQFNIPCAAPT